MTVKTEEWVQREWTQAGINLYREKGDFHTLMGFLPGPQKRTLRRAPSWSAAISLTDKPLTAFYDESNVRRVFIVTDGTDLKTEYASSAWSVSNGGTIRAGITALGGLDHRNVAYWGGKLYIIDSAGDVYAGSSYTTALTEIYDGSNALCLAAFSDYMYAATSAGDIVRLHQTTFEIIFTASATIAIEYMTAYHGHLVIFARSLDGTVAAHTFNPASPNLNTIAHVPAPPGNLPSYGSFFANHDNAIYFSPGQVKQPDGTYQTDIYRLQGTSIEYIDRMGTIATDIIAAGFLSYRRYLIHYALERDDATSLQFFRALSHRHLTTLANTTVGCYAGFTPNAYSLGGELILLANTTVPVYQFYHLGDAGLQNGYITTSWLDMGHPNKVKRLERISALLNGRATDFKVLLRYRTDDNVAWITATTGNNTHRPSVEDIGAEFYRLQLRIDLDDDTGNDEDIAIASISCLYIVDE